MGHGDADRCNISAYGSRHLNSATNCESYTDNFDHFNAPPPDQNGRHFADDIFICIFMNEKFCILIKISLKFVSNGAIDKKTTVGLDIGLAPNRRQAIS